MDLEILLITGVVEFYVWGLWQAARALDMTRDVARIAAQFIVFPAGE